MQGTKVVKARSKALVQREFNRLIMTGNRTSPSSHEASLDRANGTCQTRDMVYSLPDPVRLTRHDPDRNMARFYALALEPTLFGEVVLLRNWGRIGTSGRTAMETCATRYEAEVSAGRTLRMKLRRGYVEVACGDPCHDPDGPPRKRVQLGAEAELPETGVIGYRIGE
ncbi:MAG: WGR domain-containing protein [Proteobacteria bacterium]|nr:WGR domain-containing protein [Pseudomonadota bacterium]